MTKQPNLPKKAVPVLKIALGLLFLFVIFAVVFGLAVKDRVIKGATVQAVRQMTGFDLDVRRIHVGFLDPSIEINGLRLQNPRDFPGKEAFEIEEVLVHYHVPSLFTDEVKLRNLVLDIPKVVVVKKADGETNLERLSETVEKNTSARSKTTAKKKSSSRKEKQAAGKKKDEKPPKSVLIELLTLKLGTVEYHDYSGPGETPQIQEIALDYEGVFKDVRDADLPQLGMRVAADIAFNKLLGGDIDQVAEQLRKIGDQTGDSLRQFEKNHEGDLNALGDALEEAGANLQKSFGDIFK